MDRRRAYVSGPGHRHRRAGIGIGSLRSIAGLARLRGALHELPTGLDIYDADDRLLFANKRIGELYPWIGFPLQLGRSFEAILCEAIAAGSVPAAAGREEDWLRQRLAKRASRDGPILQSLRGGQWINIYERRTPSNFVVGVRLEVTELVARTNGLQASRERLQAVIGTAAAGIVSTNTQGVLLEANTAAATRFNTTVAAILRRPIADWIPALGSRLQPDQGGGIGASDHLAPWRDEFDGRDDQRRALRLQVSVSANGHGAELEFVIMISELTARERAEGARRLLESQLREAQKMASISTAGQRHRPRLQQCAGFDHRQCRPGTQRHRIGRGGARTAGAGDDSGRR